MLLGIVMVLSLVPFKGGIAEIWSSSWMTRREGVVKRFPRDRFFQIKNALRLVDNDSVTREQKEENKIYKLFLKF